MTIRADVLRGHTDAVILAQLMRRDSYGYEINKVIATLSNNRFELKEATLYTAFKRLEELGYRVYSGPHQAMTLSFRGKGDCEELAAYLGSKGIALRAGLHCAPLAHESAGTLETGTLRASFGHDASSLQTRALLRALGRNG